MMALRSLAAAGAALVMLAGPAAGEGLTGTWQGGYIAATSDDANRFDVKLTQQGTTLTGTMTELNAISDPAQAMFLTSTLAGSIEGRTVRFVKTYDGSGGVSHSVTYRGALDPNGRRIRGAFDAGGATGDFEMVR
jgi:hypothetical protein